MTKWYAVYTRPRCEEKVAEGFMRRKFESYCPLKEATRQWMGAKLVKNPLFKSYVFVRLEETQLSEIKKIDGVINLVYWLGKPAVIRNEEVEMIKQFLAVHKDVQLERAPVSDKETVLTPKSSWTQKEGGVVIVDAVGHQLLLPSLGYRLVVPQHVMQQNYNSQIGPARHGSFVKFG